LKFLSVHERPELAGEPDDREILRAATREERVLISNDAGHLVPIVDEFGLSGEDHFGVLLTDDRSLPRTREAIGSSSARSSHSPPAAPTTKWRTAANSSRPLSDAARFLSAPP